MHSWISSIFSFLKEGITLSFSNNSLIWFTRDDLQPRKGQSLISFIRRFPNSHHNQEHYHSLMHTQWRSFHLCDVNPCLETSWITRPSSFIHHSSFLWWIVITSTRSLLECPYRIGKKNGSPRCWSSRHTNPLQDPLGSLLYLFHEGIFIIYIMHHDVPPQCESSHHWTSHLVWSSSQF